MDAPRAKSVRKDLLDAAVAELVRLISERGAESASGDFGVLVNLDRGEHRRVQVYEVRTIRQPIPIGR